MGVVICSSIFRRRAGVDAGEPLPKHAIDTDKTWRARNRRAALDKGLMDGATSAGLVKTCLSVFMSQIPASLTRTLQECRLLCAQQELRALPVCPATAAELSEALLKPGRERECPLCSRGAVDMGTGAHHAARPFFHSSRELAVSSPKSRLRMPRAEARLFPSVVSCLCSPFVFLLCATEKRELAHPAWPGWCLLGSSAQPLCVTRETQPGAAPCSSLPCLDSGHLSSTLEVIKSLKIYWIQKL